MTVTIYNASGHPIADDTVTVSGSCQIPNVDLADPETVESAAMLIAFHCLPAVDNGDFIALPGASVLTAHVLAAIHGIAGSWPRIAWATRKNGKFVWSAETTVDLHDIRTMCRTRRPE